MKKIFYLFSIVVMGMLVASCNLNEFPTFDDKDAFAAFPTASMSIAEDGGVLNIPVHVTSLNGVATTVSYEFVNGSAKQGVDFEDASGSGTLSFGAGESQKNIAVKIINHPGVFTGDLKFSVKFKSTGDVAAGAATTCSVTINDLDHPLSAILGDYTAKGTSYFNGAQEWTMTFIKDASDVTKVWIYNIFGSDGWADTDTMFYGIANDDLTNISVPLGQETEYVYSNGNACVLLGFDGAEGWDEGTLNIAVKDGGNTLEFIDYGPWLYIPGAGSVNILYGGIVCTKD
ncbi:MAG: hypothetical protein J5702_04660 [Bacteroidales bacterium]|nr:hypothetical protein [Bacteroidales bacterium]